MDFHFTPEQEALRRQVRDFLDQNVTPAHRREYEGERTPGPLSKALLRKLGATGWLGIGWPKEYGGQGRSIMDQLVFYEELEKEHVYYGDLTITSLAMVLMRIGSEEQKKEFLPQILRGELSICLGYTEPGAGSDLANLKTRAVRDGDVYVINGQKVFTTGAQYSSHIWLLARQTSDSRLQTSDLGPWTLDFGLRAKPALRGNRGSGI
jgi:alkylation response protein AidB-like acyl-CoA dehydrogenase